jgi:Lon protease-like protein
VYAARKASSLVEDGLSSQLENVPIFPCTLAFPNQPISLNIFEPRYRLMIRRLLANGTNIFGMTMHPNPYTGEEVMYGTMLRVKRVQIHADGRSAVDTVGTWRFRIVQRHWLDGYMVAKVER